MRSKFHVEISPNADGSFPTDAELQASLRRYGWEASATAGLASDQQKLTAYKTEVNRLFNEKVVPEV
jgi:cupin superfamily acireductone dioxygenase involved in methionine salvage